MINRAARNEEVQSIISGMLSHEIPKDELSSPMFYLKILLFTPGTIMDTGNQFQLKKTLYVQIFSGAAILMNLIK